MKKLFFLFFLLVFIIGCTQKITEPKETPQNENPFENQKSCATDSDCACGRNIETGNCFYGNKKYVDTTKQCPDFCTGIAGNFRVKCINSECTQTKIETQQECSIDSDCVKDSCCHSTGCVAKDKAPNCQGMMCTMECRPNSLDCGGYCQCSSGKCTAILS